MRFSVIINVFLNCFTVSNYRFILSFNEYSAFMWINVEDDFVSLSVNNQLDNTPRMILIFQYTTLGEIHLLIVVVYLIVDNVG